MTPTRNSIRRKNKGVCTLQHQNAPRISVVMAAYNTEALVAESLRSLLAQTIADEMEIIVVDDASTDGTRQIVETMARESEQIHIIALRENGGAGHAKNVGLAACRAPYVGFCDSDDTIDSCFYERLLLSAEHLNADIAVAEICFRYPSGRTFPQPLYQDNPTADKLAAQAEDTPLGHWLAIAPSVAAGHWSAASATSKLFKTEHLRAFPFSLGMSDDIPAVLPALAAARRVTYVPHTYYYYFQRENSLERTNEDGFVKRRLQSVEAMALAARCMQSIPGSAEHIRLMVANNVFALLVTAIRTAIPAQREVLFSRFYTILRGADVPTLLDINENPYVQRKYRGYQESMQCKLREVIALFEEGRIREMAEKISAYAGQITMEKPLVSIIIPVYNGADYLAEAIVSALAQDYPNIEIIVVNDGSRDDGETDRVALAFGNRIRYLKKENGGVASALNYGIMHMQGEYFSWLSHDDLYLSQKVRVQVDTALAQDDARAIIVGGYALFDQETGETIGEVRPIDVYPRELLERPLFAVFHGLLNGCAMLIHKSHFDRVGMFDESLPTTQDYDLWFRMLRGQTPVFNDGIFVRQRSHPSQGSRSLFHMDECFGLWKGMMDGTTEDERIQMSGSVPQFFLDVHTFLQSSTPYAIPTAYAQARAVQAAWQEGGAWHRNVAQALSGARKAINCLMRLRGTGHCLLILWDTRMDAPPLGGDLPYACYTPNEGLFMPTDAKAVQLSVGGLLGAILAAGYKTLLLVMDRREALPQASDFVQVAGGLGLRTGVASYLSMDGYADAFALYIRADSVFLPQAIARMVYAPAAQNLFGGAAEAFATSVADSDFPAFVASREPTTITPQDAQDIVAFLRGCDERARNSEATAYEKARADAALQQRPPDLPCENCLRMEASMSWRITAPLRYLKGLLRRAVRGRR